MFDRLRIYTGTKSEDSVNRAGLNSWSSLSMGARIVWTPDGLPIREIAARSKTRAVGRYCSRKAGRMLPHLSRGHGYTGGEKLAIMRCEIDPEVDDFRTHHIRFDLVLEEGGQSFIPSLLQLRHDGGVAVVAVPHPEATPKLFDRVTERVEEVCQDVGWSFAVWEEADIAATAKIRDNIIQIQMERYVAYEQTDLLAVLNALRAAGGALALKELMGVLGGAPDATNRIKGMMCHGYLALPLHEQLTHDTKVALFERCSSPMLDFTS